MSDYYPYDGSIRPGIHKPFAINLSKEHGVNPSITKCFFCGEDSGIALFGQLPNDEKAPMNAGVVDFTPCSQCQEYMSKGIMLVSVKDGSDQENPYRTGSIAVIKEEVAKKIFDNIGDSRFAFIEDEAWDKLGIPRENINNIDKS